jgi:hypothetical protein
MEVHEALENGSIDEDGGMLLCPASFSCAIKMRRDFASLIIKQSSNGMSAGVNNEEIQLWRILHTLVSSSLFVLYTMQA